MNIIAKITDEMFGKKSVSFVNPRVRTGARGIVKRDDGKIAVFNKQNKNEYKLPGGGVDEGENLEEAFKREILEETGCIISDIEFLGITEELKSLDNFKQTSYVFMCNVKEETNKLYLTQKELDEGGKLLWLTPEEALEKITECYELLKESKYENLYHSKFINYRDREILKYYIKNNNA